MEEIFEFTAFDQKNRRQTWKIKVIETAAGVSILTNAEQHAFLSALGSEWGGRNFESVLQGLERGSKLAGQSTFFPLQMKHFVVNAIEGGYMLLEGSKSLPFYKVQNVIKSLPGVEEV